MEGQVIEVAYALDTFYFLVMGAFVMWMAAGFSMLEAGMVRSKSVVEILTKNISGSHHQSRVKQGILSIFNKFL